MPRYIVHFKYAPEGHKGLLKDKASSREQFLRHTYEKAGGKLEAMYWLTSGDHSGVCIVDADRDFNAAFSAAVLGSGAIAELKSQELMTSAEMDKALAKPATYKAPGA